MERLCVYHDRQEVGEIVVSDGTVAVDPRIPDTMVTPILAQRREGRLCGKVLDKIAWHLLTRD